MRIVARLRARVARRDETDAFAAIGPGKISRHPHDVAKIRRRVEADGADAVEGYPIVSPVDDGLENRAEPLVGVGDPFESLIADRAARGRRGVESLGADLLRLLDLADRREAQGLDQQRDPILRLPEYQRRARAGKDLVAQRLAIGLHHRKAAGVEVAGYLELGQCAVPPALDRQELEQEYAQLGIRRVL